ncbi:MAG TPA: hypothetical protein VH165_32115 [Kofleriaceae bacterium]|jgi:hypothetical protein|nr:hypothetical protein [Kofleriaceae bacterium]
MTRSTCDQVAERIALGEALGELAEHATACAGCQGLVAASAQLGRAHHAVDPGLGFTARMTIGAQHRIAVRRRRKLAVGLAATLACGAFGVFVVTHTPDEPPVARPTVRLPQPRPHEPDPVPDKVNEPAAASDDDALAALAQLADVDHNSRLTARWSEIDEPLTPYKKLIEGVTP